ncbi:hypothetical protein KSP40_PGU010519 [Platanthera guangdongensis]|uniref:Uncharacterized protein n=1 Tax=Platanthera guangdongensis TaxID=2320717 RepID=A0ABR2MF72_9ASPA
MRRTKGRWLLAWQTEKMNRRNFLRAMSRRSELLRGLSSAHSWLLLSLMCFWLQGTTWRRHIMCNRAIEKARSPEFFSLEWDLHMKAHSTFPLAMHKEAATIEEEPPSSLVEAPLCPIISIVGSSSEPSSTAPLYFFASSMPIIETTQLQDCPAPSGGVQLEEDTGEEEPPTSV